MIACTVAEHFNHETEGEAQKSYEPISSARGNLRRREGRSISFLPLYTNLLVNPDRTCMHYFGPTNLILLMSSPSR
jgi:hypothetical protein